MFIQTTIIVCSFLFIFPTNSQSAKDNQTLTVKIETSKGSGKFIEKDVIEFIEDGKKARVDGCEIIPSQKKLVMVMGLTGTGKSTLIHYLNHIPLVCKKIKDKWILDLQSQNVTLPCGFKIGHGTRSETLYPALYSPPNTDFTYVDNPGFRDTRGFGIEISNSFFREQVTSKATDLKFLLLITHPDLNLRGQQFRDSMKGFSDFLGVFDDANAKNVSKSIGIIVTRVDNDGDTDEEMKEILKERLFEILDEEKETQRVTTSEEDIFRQIISNNQIEIFSNPRIRGLVRTKQSEQIIALINRLNYTKKSDLKIRVRISDSYLLQLHKYTNMQLLKLVAALDASLTKCFIQYDKQISATKDIKDYAQISSNLNEFLIKANQSITFETFIASINEQIFNKSLKNEFINKKMVVDYFIQIMPDQYKPTMNKQWASVTLITMVKQMLSRLMPYYDSLYKDYQKEVEITLNQALINYFPKKVDEATYIEEITNFQRQLNKIRSEEAVTIEKLLSYIDERILDKNGTEALLAKNNELNAIIQKLPAERQASLPNARIWISGAVEKRLEKLVSELEMYYIDADGLNYYDNYIYHGHFTKMSTVLAKLNSKERMTSLKVVKIYTTHSFIFDTHYSIDRSKYDTNAPDLIIVSPKIIIPGAVNVDVSSHATPRSHISNTVHGRNGQPGLTGFNSGRVLIIANTIDNPSALSIKANGGHGGSGQDGGDGVSGKSVGGCGGFGGNGGIITIMSKNYTYNGNGKQGAQGQPGAPNGDSNCRIDTNYNPVYRQIVEKEQTRNLQYKVKTDYLDFLSSNSYLFPRSNLMMRSFIKNPSRADFPTLLFKK